MTIQEQMKQDWMDSWLEDYIYGRVPVSGKEDLSTLAEAAWKKRCEDGPDDTDSDRDLSWRDSPSLRQRELDVKWGAR